jgi:hypothetical protein
MKFILLKFMFIGTTSYYSFMQTKYSILSTKLFSNQRKLTQSLLKTKECISKAVEFYFLSSYKPNSRQNHTDLDSSRMDHAPCWLAQVEH